MYLFGSSCFILLHTHSLWTPNFTARLECAVLWIFFSSHRNISVTFSCTEDMLGCFWSGATTSLWDASFLHQLKPKRSVDLCLTSHDSLKRVPTLNLKEFYDASKNVKSVNSLIWEACQLNDWFMSSFRQRHSATPYEFQAQFGWPPLKTFYHSYLWWATNKCCNWNKFVLFFLLLILTWYCVSNVFIFIFFHAVFPSYACPCIP